MTTFAELNETVDRFSRRVDTIIAENARRDAEAARRDAEAARRDAAYKAQQVERDAQWQRSMEAMQKSFDKEHKKTEDAIRKVADQFNSQWGRFVESLCANQVVPLLKSRGIEVERISPRQKCRLPAGGEFEIDIIAINGDTVVMIEVKTTLRPEDVEWFVEKLGYAREKFKEYLNHRILGGVAFLHADSGVTKLSQKRGFFTILATGEGAVITNPKEFVPKEW